MQKIIWEVRFLSLPPVMKYCKKCGKKERFVCSGMFRVNAQRKSLDIWLIYQCSRCDTTWNLPIFSRISVHKIDREQLSLFHENDPELVERYASDYELLRRSGVEAVVPEYRVEGEALPERCTVQLLLKSAYPAPLKVSSILREKLSLSQRELERLVLDKKIRSDDGLDFLKWKLDREQSLTICT